jgi:DNA replication protein DnaC
MQLEGLLEKLEMDHLDAQLDAVCEQAAQQELDYKSFLAQALNTARKWRPFGCPLRGIETRLRQARFPWAKTLEQFDFDFQPSLDRRQVRELARLSTVSSHHTQLWQDALQVKHRSLTVYEEVSSCS